MKRIFFLLLFVQAIAVKAQTTTFQKMYGDTITEDGFSVCKSKHDNGYVYTGQAQYVSNQMLIVKTDQFGDTLWTKTITNANGSQGRCVIQTLDSGYVVLGTCNMTTGNDILLVKLDKNGQSLWSKMYDNATNSDYGRTVIEDASGSLYVGGQTTPGNVQPVVMKLNKNGNIKWAKVYQSAYNRQVESISLSPNGNLVVAGQTEDSVTISQDPLVFKVDTADGSFFWARYHIGNLGSVFYSVITNSNNDIIAAGGTQDYNSNSALRSAVVAKFNSSGSLLQFNSYSDCAFSTVMGYQIVRNVNAGYALTGFAMPCPLQSLNSFLLLLDGSQNVVSHTFYGTTTSTISGWGLIQEPNDAGYVIVGSEMNNSASPVNSDASLVRVSSTGYATCETFTSGITGAAFTPSFIAASFSITNGITSSTFSPTYSVSLKITTKCVTVDTKNNGEIAKTGIKAWPNPFTNEFFVGVPPESLRKVSMCDITGKKVDADFESSAKGFKVKGQFANGIYLLTLEQKDGYLQTLRLNCLGN
jgi:hypothetical protein